MSEPGFTAVGEPEVCQETSDSSRRLRWVFLTVQAGVMLGLVWKLGGITPRGLVWDRGFFMLADEVYHRMPLDDPFFPAWLRSATVVRWAYLGTLAAIIMGTICRWRIIRLLFSVATLAGLSILCVHQASYNDATFVTSWWVVVWTYWFVLRMDDSDHETTLRRGALLSRLILSMILLGGAVGKWTAAYWSGDVFYDIYFLDRDQWLFNWLRSHFEPESLREIATWYSRKVIVLETLCGFGLWMLPARWAASVGIVLFFSIAAFSNFWLFSVTWPLIGLAAVGLFVVGPRTTVS